MAYSCLSNAASAAACAGELDRALDFSDRCLALVVPNGLLRLSVYAETARAALLRRLGRLAEAARACDAARRLRRAGRAARARRPGPARARAARPGVRGPGGRRGRAGRRPGARRPGRPSLGPAAAGRGAGRAGRADQAETELRAAVLEPVGPGDFPATLVARMSRVQGLIAAGRGDTALAAAAPDRVARRLAAHRPDAQRPAGGRRVRRRAHRPGPPAGQLAGRARPGAGCRHRGTRAPGPARRARAR